MPALTLAHWPQVSKTQPQQQQPHILPSEGEQNLEASVPTTLPRETNRERPSARSSESPNKLNPPPSPLTLVVPLKPQSGVSD
ncbi:hypothetical protein PGT21_002745 [Puccinia graminis f. sp. tritici]|uniref:Uncharacterized protein n=1 Tax=Puccinia graminis f. sp. tritici TaxID=56615 RepID=A0A5B0LMH1_PUCGR|nr:hypothetical protein PGT21_002745 [Puccinia graminis f. sp. tritici]KAA1079966.1 hypothetical protein PGTUg99_014714 [Puccinia graminis f. sp. tritici]